MLAFGFDSEEIYTLTEMPTDKCIDIACSNDHIVFLTSDGEVSNDLNKTI